MNLQPDDWIRAAQGALRTQGLAGVRVETLARDLGVSKGSFYWHFPNRAALLEAIVGQWEAKTAWLIAESRHAPTAIERIQRLLFLIGTKAGPTGGNVDDAAMFLWARQDQQIGARVKAIEQQRIAYIQELFMDTGCSPTEAHLRAEFAYIAFVGYSERLERVGEAGLGFADFCRLALQLLGLQ